MHGCGTLACSCLTVAFSWQALRAHNASAAMKHLWLAGSDYSGNGLGYIDGAIKSGRSAAIKIIKHAHALAPKLPMANY